MSPFIALLQKEIRIELRQKHAIAGVLMYVVATVFICYLSFERIESARTWGALLWLTGLFTAFNAMQRTFVSESQGTQLYLYSLVHPRWIILSKAVYQAMMVALLNLTSFFFFFLFFGSKIIGEADLVQLFLGIALGSTGLGLGLTFVAGLAYKSGNGIGLVAILGFPIIIPLLITIVRHSTAALEGAGWDENGLNLLVLLVLNVLSLVLAYILFPYIWRD
jgi:heme exporter protein B